LLGRKIRNREKVPAIEVASREMMRVLEERREYTIRESKYKIECIK